MCKIAGFKLHHYYPGWVGVGVEIIRLKANSVGLNEPTGTELGNKNNNNNNINKNNKNQQQHQQLTTLSTATTITSSSTNNNDNNDNIHNKYYVTNINGKNNNKITSK